MAILDPTSSFRRHPQTVHLAPAHAAAAAPRRATVSSPAPAPSFTFSNTFESHRPRSRTDRYFERPYPYRRSTVSGQSQGHNVNNAAQLLLQTPHADEAILWSASSSPIMSSVVLQDTSPAPSSSSCASPRLAAHAPYDFPFTQALNSPINSSSSFALCPSPEVSSSMDHPRTMPPPPLFSTSFHPAIRPATASTTASSSVAALSPAPSSASPSFALDVHPPPAPPSSESPRYHPSDRPPHTLSREDLTGEVTRLRDRVHHLEFINDLVRLRVAELESDNKARVHADLGLVELAADVDGPSAAATATAPHPAFAFVNQDLGPPPPDWEPRTAARLKRFCALNRAGNALCAWHDSRRERRAHPPRMAPPETLNCGCTYAEALFEESLTRNGVGAFHPGENVRMDPALRNPLLGLLQQRYGYRDGDFERTPEGGWRDGEDARAWEQRAASSGRSTRRDHR